MWLIATGIITGTLVTFLEPVNIESNFNLSLVPHISSKNTQTWLTTARVFDGSIALATNAINHFNLNFPVQLKLIKISPNSQIYQQTKKI